jgi:hypothetical protein
MYPFKIIFGLLLLTLFSCKQIKWVGTDKGGCNDLSQEKIMAKKGPTEKPDTVYYKIANEVLTIYIGVNHICCTPFTTKTSIEGNLITMEVIDTCPAPDYNCYCKCNCYYTFDFKFKDFAVKEYTYQLYLKEARAAEPKLIAKGEIDIKSLGLR